MTVGQVATHRSRLPRVPSIFCPTPAAQGVVRALPPLTVLRAPRGFGKTSTVAYWLRSGALDDRAAVWITLPVGSSQEGLWVAVHDSLVLAGLADAEGQPDHAAVDHALRRLTRRLVLVIDGLHHMTDTEADEALVELTQAHELLNLVVMSREDRPIESIGPATVDAAVLRVAELALGPEEVVLLGTRLGVSLAAAEAQNLVTEFAGWPALARAVLLETRRDADGGLAIGKDAVARHASLMLADLENAAWRGVMMALAVPEGLRPEDLSLLLDGPEDVATGLLILRRSFTMIRTGGVAAYPRGLRDALLETLLTQDPQRYRELNERMSRRRREQDEPVEALRHALRAEAWPLVLGLLEENWAQLLRRHADEVGAAVRALPPELVASSPRLVVARDYVLDQDVATQAEAALRGGLLVPGGDLPMRSLTTTQRLARRFAGTPTYGAGELMSGRLDSAFADDGTPQLAPEVQRAVPELLTEWALSMLYDNDGVRAAYGFALAYREAMRVHDDAAAREAASGTALAMALLGHTHAASDWGRHAAELSTTPTGLELVAAPFTVRVLAGLRLADPGVPAESVPAVTGGLRPLVEVSRVATAFADILHGRLDRARVELQRHATDHDGDHEEMVRASVTALRIDLALAEGRLDRAGALLAATARGSAWTLATRARHAFYVGAYAEALRLTEDAAGFAGTRPRVGLELLLLHACASWRTGSPDVAVDHLATAVGIAADTEVLLPFLTVPRADLEAMAPAGSWTREFLERPPLAGTDTVFPEPLRAGELSEAELRVLRELRGGVSLAHIGRRLYLSESTVKTHVRRIYRKLGVSARADAVQRARELSLIE